MGLDLSLVPGELLKIPLIILMGVGQNLFVIPELREVKLQNLSSICVLLMLHKNPSYVKKTSKISYSAAGT